MRVTPGGPIVLLSALLLTPATPAWAQTVRGTVVEDESGVPFGSVEVTVLDKDDTVVSAPSNPVRVGMKGGMNLSRFYGAEIGNSETLSAPVWGLFAQFDLGGALSLQPELNYSKRGAKEADLLDLGPDGVWRYNYIDAIALLRFRVTPRQSSPSFSLFAGPVLSLLGSAQATGLRPAGFYGSCSECETGFRSPQYVDYTMYDYTKGSDVGGTLGLAFDFDAGPAKLVLDLRYTRMMSEVDKAPFDDVYSRKHSALAFQVGVSFAPGSWSGGRPRPSSSVADPLEHTVVIMDQVRLDSLVARGGPLSVHDIGIDRPLGNQLMAWLPAPARAQIVRGTVQDDELSVPIEAVEVALLASDGRVVGRYVTTKDGQFFVRVSGRDSYRLLATRIGYEPSATDAFALAPGQGALVELRLKLTSSSVRVDGHWMRVQTAGLKNAESGTPVVVFEAGFGAGFGSWRTIVQGVADFAPVVAYDRSGIGGSEQDGVWPTPQHVAENLHALLAQLGAKPPYVLVGHSLGGPFIQMFTALYPDEVAGLVYVDPTDTPTEPAAFEVDAALGRSAEESRRYLESLQRGLDELPTPGERAEMEVFLHLLETHFPEFQSLPPVPDVPVAVLVAAEFQPEQWEGSSGTGLDCEPRECHERSLELRVSSLSALTRDVTNGTLEVVKNSGHYMQRDDPDRVVRAIRRVVETNAARRPDSD